MFSAKFYGAFRWVLSIKIIMEPHMFWKRIKDGLDNFDKIQVRYLNDLIFDIVKSIVIKSRDLILFDPLDFKKLTEKTAYS